MIRLTLLLLAGLFGAMLVFGEETPDLAAKRIDETVLDSDTQSAAAPQAEAESPQPETEPVVVVEEEKIAPAVEVAVSEALETPVVEAVVETTKQETLDLTQPASFNGLIVVESTDSSADAAQAVAEELTATFPIEDEPATETPPRLYYVTGSSVNLRAGPSTGVAVVGSLRRGTQAEFIAEAESGWWQIRDTNTGQVGFMAARFLAPVE